MIDLPDLDPQDHTNRVLVRDQLRHLRSVMHGSTNRARLVSLAAGCGSRFIEDCEATTQWSVRRVCRWARIVEHRFRMTVTGLEVPAADLTADLLRVGTPFGGLDEDGLHILAVIDDLARYRIHRGLTFNETGRRIGVDGSAVRGWEDHPRRVLLKTAQRYARGLGGALALAVVPVSAAVPA